MTEPPAAEANPLRERIVAKWGNRCLQGGAEGRIGDGSWVAGKDQVEGVPQLGQLLIDQVERLAGFNRRLGIEVR